MLEIRCLTDVPEHIPQLAAWHYAQWGEWNPADDVAARIAEFQAHLQSSGIPRTFVATDGNEVLGSASLTADDLDIRPELTPWLASVFVAPSARNQGIGTMLVQRVVAEARELGVPQLHLFTPDRERFYAAMGWQLMERVLWRDHEIAVMTFRF